MGKILVSLDERRGRIVSTEEEEEEKQEIKGRACARVIGRWGKKLVATGTRRK